MQFCVCLNVAKPFLGIVQPPLVYNRIWCSRLKNIIVAGDETLCCTLQASSNPGLTSRRRVLTDDVAELCGGSGMPVSQLLLATEHSFSNDAVIRAGHRTQISRHDCTCQKCSARKMVGDLFLPQGKRPNAVFAHLKVVRGAMQKYYTVSTHAADAVQVSVGKIRSGPVTLTTPSFSKLISLGISERTRGPFDDIVRINALRFSRDDVNSSQFRPAYWASLVIIICVGLGLAVCIIYGLSVEWRYTGAVDCSTA